MDKSIYFKEINNLIDEHNIQVVDFADCNGCEICRKIELIRKDLEKKEKMKYEIYKKDKLIGYANNKKQIQKITKISLNQIAVENFVNKEINGFLIKITARHKTEVNNNRRYEYELYRNGRHWTTVKSKRELAEMLGVTYWTVAGEIDGKYFNGVKVVYK